MMEPNAISNVRKMFFNWDFHKNICLTWMFRVSERTKDWPYLCFFYVRKLFCHLSHNGHWRLKNSFQHKISTIVLLFNYWLLNISARDTSDGFTAALPYSLKNLLLWQCSVLCRITFGRAWKFGSTTFIFGLFNLLFS